MSWRGTFLIGLPCPAKSSSGIPEAPSADGEDALHVGAAALIHDDLLGTTTQHPRQIRKVAIFTKHGTMETLKFIELLRLGWSQTLENQCFFLNKLSPKK